MDSNFSENYAVMGLEDIGDNCYSYTDQYSSIKYFQLITKNSGIDIPCFAIFVKPTDIEVDPNDSLEGYRYVGNISGSYQFIGNDILAQTIRESISAAGQAVFREYPILTPNLTTFMTEMVIENPTSINEIGTVKPQINLSNSYNGTAKASVNFGFSIYEDGAIENRNGFGFDEKMITLKQIHVQSSSTLMTGAVTGYVDIFSNNITQLIEENFNREIPEEDAMKVLELIEKSGAGKNRTSMIAEFFKSIENKTSWNMFHAITRFSTIEKNLNAKKLLENVAESVLIVPAQMINAIEEFNGNIAQIAQAA